MSRDRHLTDVSRMKTGRTSLAIAVGVMLLAVVLLLLWPTVKANAQASDPCELGSPIVFAGGEKGSSITFMDNEGERFLTDPRYFGISPEISPDGKYAAFIAQGNGEYNIAISQIDSDYWHLISDTNSYLRDFAWTLDSTLILGVTDGANSTFRFQNVIGNQTREPIDVAGEIFSFDLSPDGTKIAYDAMIDLKSNVYTVSLTGEVKKVTNDGSSDFPIWSPDAKYIAYSKTLDKGFETYVWDGQKTEKIDLPYEIVWATDWTLDSSSLLMSVYDAASKRYQVVLYNLATGSYVVNKLFDSSWGAKVSPDGDQIVFQSSFESDNWIALSDLYFTQGCTIALGQQPSWMK